jgi:hypothetical protein
VGIYCKELKILGRHFKFEFKIGIIRTVLENYIAIRVKVTYVPADEILVTDSISNIGLGRNVYRLLIIKLPT